MVFPAAAPGPTSCTESTGLMRFQPLLVLTLDCISTLLLAMRHARGLLAAWAFPLLMGQVPSSHHRHGAAITGGASGARTAASHLAAGRPTGFTPCCDAALPKRNHTRQPSPCTHVNLRNNLPASHPASCASQHERVAIKSLLPALILVLPVMELSTARRLLPRGSQSL